MTNLKVSLVFEQKNSNRLCQRQTSHHDFLPFLRCLDLIVPQGLGTSCSLSLNTLPLDLVMPVSFLLFRSQLECLSLGGAFPLTIPVVIHQQGTQLSLFLKLSCLCISSQLLPPPGGAFAPMTAGSCLPHSPLNPQQLEQCLAFGLNSVGHDTVSLTITLQYCQE